MRKRIVLLAFLVVVFAVTCALAVACDKTEKYTVTWALDENVASVTVDGYEYAETMEFEEGTAVSFTVTFKTGYEALSVLVGKKTVYPNNGVYTFTVSQNVTVTVNSKLILSSISVEMAEAAQGKVYHAGDKIADNDLVVTAHYADDSSKEITGWSTVYASGNEFALGDTSFTVSFQGKTAVVELGYEVVGMITLDLNGGTMSADELAKLPGGYTMNGNVITWTFDKAFEADYTLPAATRTINGVEFGFARWSGVEDNKIAAGNAVSVKVIALYNIRLVEVVHMQFTTDNDGIPYLEITGNLVAVDDAYIYFYEGNEPPVKYDPEVTISKEDGNGEFTVKLNLADLANATPVYGGEKEFDGDLGQDFLGKWLDIRFAAMYENELLQQELILEEDDNYANLGDDVVAKVGDSFYRFFYQTWTPAAGDLITGGNGAQFTGKESILKLAYEVADGYQITGVTLAEREGKAYLVISGKGLGTKADVEADLADYIADMQNFSNWANVSIDGMQTLTVNDDTTFEIALCLDNVVEEGKYVMHITGGGNFDPSNYDRSVEITIGTRTYTMGEADPHGWGWAWTCIEMTDSTYANNKSVILEDGKPYFVLMGEAGERDADGIKAALTQFDFEDETDSSNKIIIDPSKIIVTVENGIYTVKVDISELPVGKYWIHAVGLVDGNGDVAPDASKPGVTVNDTIYRGIDDPRDTWTAHLLEVAADTEGRFALETVGLEADEEHVYLVYTGSYKNYTEDELKALFANKYAMDIESGTRKLLVLTCDVDVDAGTFTLKADIADYSIYPANGFYYMHGAVLADGQTLADLGEDANIRETACAIAEGKNTVTLGDMKYTLGAQWGTRGVTIEDLNPAVYTVTSTELAEQDGKAVMIIKGTVANYKNSGSVYVATVLNGGAYTTTERTEHVALFVEDGNFTATWDLSSTGLASGSQYWIHFSVAGKDLPANTVIADKVEITVDDVKYTIVGLDAGANSPQIKAELLNAPVIKVNGHLTLEKSNDKMYLVITGTYANVNSEDDLKAALSFDAQRATDWSRTSLTDFDVTMSDGTYTVKVDITSLATGEYLVHAFINSDSNDVDSGTTGIDAIQCGDKSYSYENHDFGGWNRYVLTIK